ncbi:hypothetical protein BW716_14775 [[Flexibacter] sp. ATCC 35208]|nr:hypothetical protein BW716_14775 [[Flexibacter] sp. ATCC 35208]
MLIVLNFLFKQVVNYAGKVVDSLVVIRWWYTDPLLYYPTNIVDFWFQTKFSLIFLNKVKNSANTSSAGDISYNEAINKYLCMSFQKK